jgi:hypothetical protein
VLDAVWCPLDKTREIAVRLREIKQKHGLSARFKIKWTKVSPAKKAGQSHEIQNSSRKHVAILDRFRSRL